MVHAISLVVPDAGPLISLAMADQLDLFEAFAVPIATLDVVKAECLCKDWPGRERLDCWFKTNANRVEIIESPLLSVYLAAIDVERTTKNPGATRGLGDAAITWFVANAPFLRKPRTTLLILTEDAAFGDSRLGRDVHVLSTRAFLQTLENLDIIASAKAVLDEIESSGRKVAPYTADRPALVGVRGKSKTNWKAALKGRGSSKE